jgi:hypothetical protein
MADPDDPRDRDLDDLARRFLALWQQQLAAMATDPALAEGMGRMFANFGQVGRLFAEASAAMEPSRDGTSEAEADTSASGRTRRSAAAAAAPGDGGMALDELQRRLADVERRLAAVEARAGGRGRGAKPRADRRRTR